MKRVFETAECEEVIGIPYFWCSDTKSTRTRWKVVAWNWKRVTGRWTR